MATEIALHMVLISIISNTFDGCFAQDSPKQLTHIDIKCGEI